MCRKLFFIAIVLFNCSAKATNIVECGELSFTWNTDLNKKSEVAINLGEFYSCQFEDIGKNILVEVNYKLFSLEITANEADKLITNYMTEDLNVMNLDVEVKKAGEFNFNCFDYYGLDKSKVVRKCVAFYKSKKIEVTTDTI